MARNKAKNKELTVKEKINLIEEQKKQPTSIRKIAQKYKISKSQVQRVLQNQNDIIKRKNDRSFLKRQRLRRRLIHVFHYMGHKIIAFGSFLFQPI